MDPRPRADIRPAGLRSRGAWMALLSSAEDPISEMIRAQINTISHKQITLH